MNIINGIGGALQADCEREVMCKQAEPDTILAKLEQRRLHLQSKLDEVTAARKFINEHPEFIQFMDIVGKALRY